MRYIIYGAGAIGGGIGVLLQRHGHEVVLIARGAHLARMLTDGLTARTPHGTFTEPVTAVDHPAEIEFREDDVVLLTTKSQDSIAALDTLRAIAGPGIPVICAQNGVNNEREAARRFTRVYAMLVMMPSTFLDPGEVVLHGTPISAWLDAGRYPHGLDPLIEQVCADISTSGMIAKLDPLPMRIKYAKLRSNLNNAMDALIGNESRGGPVVARMIEEADAAFAAAGIDVATPEELGTRHRAVMSQGDVPGYERRGTSAWQSLARGRGIEADYLNGEIALLGALHGVPTPYNRAVQILSNDAARRGDAPGTGSETVIAAYAEQLAAAGG
ncbi:MAG: ketopantoate reductase family protein [Chloroflexi bacterium]|nr:ketopantoate reductase family protein [Chloroflexota bacterium]MDA1145413.1 ketopantoate reductase family protein [Chloroflexota bacterium]